MIQIRSWVDIADNTGARKATMIGVIGRKTNFARVGDVITANVKEAAPDGTVKKSEVVRAVVVRTRFPVRRADGSYLRFDTNAAVIIDKDQNPRGTRRHRWCRANSPSGCRSPERRPRSGYRTGPSR